MKELISIQNELVAKKSQYNPYGKFNYRSCEDILEALKPLLLKYQCFVTLDDAIYHVGDRYYVEAQATIYNSEGKSVSVKALARESENGSGNMSQSQVTGSSSSYARKYALNGLFAIDDAKDDDYLNNGSKPSQPKPQTKPQPSPRPQQSPKPIDVNLKDTPVVALIQSCNSTDELKDLFASLSPADKEATKPYFTNRKNELNNGTQAKQ